MFTKFYDTHCHVNLSPLNSESDIIYLNAKKHRLKINNIGVDLPSSIAAIELAKRFKNMYATIAIHPNDVKDYDDNIFNTFENLIINNSKYIVAIGETGLDYHYKGFDDKKQKAFFIKHINLAKKYNLPLVVHVRDAYEDLIRILKKHKSKELKIVIHCYVGNLKQAKALYDLGCYFSFTGNLTYGYSWLLEALDFIPLERILSETDAPWIIPKNLKTKVNYPINVKLVVDFIARVKKISFKKAAKIIYQNGISFFNIKNIK